MTHFGPEAHFRLRGDTIGYIVELLQGYMVDRFNAVFLLAMHRQGSNIEEDTRRPGFPRRVVQKDDIVLAFRRQTALFNQFLSSCYSSNQTSCDVSAGYHGQVESPIDCSCSLPSSSGIVWRWPLDNCHDVLPAEAGRRIIRRLTYFANISEMSNEAFILAEAELLHALGGLLVSAYESCVDIEKTRKTQLLGVEEELTVRCKHIPSWMFKSSPPPFYPKPVDDYPDDHPDDAVVYTIVPGQIETAAEQRDITPRKVYGETWVAILGFSPEEEKKTERSYYYKETFHGDTTEESDSDSIDNDWAGEYDEDEKSNIDYEMDMHYYYDSKEDMDLYYDSEMEMI